MIISQQKIHSVLYRNQRNYRHRSKRRQPLQPTIGLLLIGGCTIFLVFNTILLYWLPHDGSASFLVFWRRKRPIVLPSLCDDVTVLELYQHISIESAASPTERKEKLWCGLLAAFSDLETMGAESKDLLLQSIRDTWGSKCDALVTEVTSASLQKRLNDDAALFDWFLLVRTDQFVLVENVWALIESINTDPKFATYSNTMMDDGSVYVMHNTMWESVFLQSCAVSNEEEDLIQCVKTSREVQHRRRVLPAGTIQPLSVGNVTTTTIVYTLYAHLYYCRIRQATLSHIKSEQPIRVVQRASVVLQHHEEWPPVSTLYRIADNHRRIVVVIVNCGYIDFADNLVASMLQYNVTNVVLVPMDLVSYHVLLRVYPDNVIPPPPTAKDEAASPLSYDATSFLDLNRHRPLILRSFAHRDLTFLYLDADIVWRDNLLEFLEKRRGGGDSIEVDAVLTYDNSASFAQLCSCVLYMRPTHRNMEFLRLWDAEYGRNQRQHDQMVLNDMLGWNTASAVSTAGPFSYRVLNISDGLWSGAQYFEEEQHAKERDQARMVHNNWIVGKKEKQKRWEEHNLWHPSGRLEAVRYHCGGGGDGDESSVFLTAAVATLPKNLQGYPEPVTREPQSLSRASNGNINATLVVLIGSARGGEPTWESLYKNLLDPNQADLALMFGSSSSDVSSSLYGRAKFAWYFPEYHDWSPAVDEAYNITHIDNQWKWRVMARATAPNGPFGGTKEDPSSSGVINSLARHFVAQRLQKLKLLDKYERFVITRSDQFYPCPLYMGMLPRGKVWIPTGEDWDGICDRFWIVDSKDVLKSLNILEPAVNEPSRYDSWRGNVESFIRLRLQEEGLWERIGRFRRTMFTASVIGDPTRWRGERRKPALTVGDKSIHYKYGDEYYQAMTSCDLE